MPSRSPSPNPAPRRRARKNPKKPAPAAVVSVAELRELFDEVDMDASGTINWYELSLALQSAGQDASKAKEMVMTADTDGDGEIDFDEFVEVIMMTSNFQTDEWLAFSTSLKHKLIKKAKSPNFSQVEPHRHAPPTPPRAAVLASPDSGAMLKLQIPIDFGEEPYSIATLIVADAIAWYCHTQTDGAFDESSLFRFYFSCCAWLSVGIVCKVILKYGFNCTYQNVVPVAPVVPRSAIHNPSSGWVGLRPMEGCAGVCCYLVVVAVAFVAFFVAIFRFHLLLPCMWDCRTKRTWNYPGGSIFGGSVTLCDEWCINSWIPHLSPAMQMDYARNPRKTGSIF
eukprot:SAG31_NODE_5266_length_2642_cov_2.705466_1_plen_339_part_00